MDQIRCPGQISKIKLIFKLSPKFLATSEKLFLFSTSFEVLPPGSNGSEDIEVQI